MNSFSSRRRNSGFSLVEMLVAVGILAILLIIILVPIRLAVDSMSLGKSRANLQQSAQAAMTQIETDIRRAIYVFPNEAMRGITDQPPYSGDPTAAPFSGNLQQPYFLSNLSTDTGATPTGVCTATNPTTGKGAWSNPSRLDLLLPRRNGDNSLAVPIQPGDTIVTYYARREKYTSSTGTVPDYDILDNPMMLFRAQFPFRYGDATRADYPAPGVANARNANVETTRYSSSYTKDGVTKSCTTNAVALNRETRWLSHNFLGEANLQPLCTDATTGGSDLVLGTHTSVIPTGTGLVTPNAINFPTTARSLVTSNSFACQDTNSDGKIDRVTVNLAVEEYDGGNADVRSGKPNSQVFRLKRIIDLPNVR